MTALDARVTVLLTQLTRAVYRRTPESRLGMTLKQFAALAVVREQSGIPQQELGELLCIDANNLVILLNDLERENFVVRRRDPSDRRRHLVDITPEGVVAFEQAEDAIAAVEEDVLGSLSTAERGTLRRLLAQAVEASTAAARA